VFGYATLKPLLELKFPPLLRVILELVLYVFASSISRLKYFDFGFHGCWGSTLIALQLLRYQWTLSLLPLSPI
jgi:hypothetical protein